MTNDCMAMYDIRQRRWVIPRDDGRKCGDEKIASDPFDTVLNSIIAVATVSYTIAHREAFEDDSSINDKQDSQGLRGSGAQGRGR